MRKSIVRSSADWLNPAGLSLLTADERKRERVDDVELHTIKRRSDDPKLEIGETVLLKDGVTGVVLARYTPSTHRDELWYIVAVPSQKQRKRPR